MLLFTALVRVSQSQIKFISLETRIGWTGAVSREKFPSTKEIRCSLGLGVSGKETVEHMNG